MLATSARALRRVIDLGGTAAVVPGLTLSAVIRAGLTQMQGQGIRVPIVLGGTA
ncbi:MAG: hypothetical protein ABJA34_07520 [Pseudonocardiales bacterium]